MFRNHILFSLLVVVCFVGLVVSKKRKSHESSGGSHGSHGRHGSHGSHSAEDPCVNNPCENGGTCGLNATDNDLPICRCPVGFAGDYCETDIDDCYLNPCLNGGSCTDMVNSFMCNCDDTGFNGSTCANNIDDCSPNPCQNGGVCSDRVLSFDCCCSGGFIGQNCSLGCRQPGYTWDDTWSFCYKYYTVSTQYAPAEAQCVADGGHLLTLRNVEMFTWATTLATAITGEY